MDKTSGIDWPTSDSFVNFAHSLGVGTNNPLTSSTYGFNPITKQRVLLEFIHRGSWLGGVAVDVVADDMTKAGVEIISDLDPRDISRIEERAIELGVWGSINEAIKWSRLYGGSIAVFLIDGQNLATPLRLDTIKEGQFKGLCTLDRWMVEPSLNDLITEYGPNLGLPKFYRVTAQAQALQGKKIHYSRCIRLEGIRLPYWQRVNENLWGLSILERLYDRMLAYDSASTGAAQLVYKSYIRTYKIKEMREIIAAGGDAMKGLIKYIDMIRQFQGIEGMTLLDSEDEFASATHGAFAGISDALQQFGQQISGALQIPLVRLFGQSPAGFASGETDLRAYYDTIRQVQMKELKPGILTLYRALSASEGIDFPAGTKIEFKPLWQLTEEQKANIVDKVTRALGQMANFSIIDKETCLKELRQLSYTTGIYSNITEEKIEKAKEEDDMIKDIDIFNQLEDNQQNPNSKRLVNEENRTDSTPVV